MLLLIDTVGTPDSPGVAAALWRDGAVIAAHRVAPGRGALERLFPMVATLLDGPVGARARLEAVVAAVGPGGFATMRAGVAAARGLALGLGRPALGLSWLDAIGFAAPGAVCACLPAPGGGFAAQDFLDCAPLGPPRRLDAAPEGAIGSSALGAAALEIFGRCAAARLTGEPPPRPAPLYLRPPDAVKAPPPPQAL